MRVKFEFCLLDCVCCNEDFVIQGFIPTGCSSKHFTVSLAGLKNVAHYNKDNG